MAPLAVSWPAGACARSSAAWWSWRWWSPRVRAASGGGSAPDLPTAEVKKGEFVDALEIRGDIRPLKSVVLAAPMQAGELQIVKLAKNGTLVKAGDVVVEFDGSTLRRTMQEKQSELKQAEAEIEQATAQARITKEQNATELMRAHYNIERAKLDVQTGRHCLADREREGEARGRRRRAEAARARGEDEVGRRVASKRISPASAASARRRCSISSAPSAACRTCS